VAPSGTPGGRVSVRFSATDPNRMFLDFDPAAPGGRGGASVRIDPVAQSASIDGVFRNARLPPRSTGGLLADALRQAGLPHPLTLEAYNVDRGTAAVQATGGTGQGTRLGNMLEDIASALGGVIVQWEPVPDGGVWHLRIHMIYPSHLTGGSP
jgi:hypothetical protein